MATAAASAGDESAYALEGSIFVAGAAVQWLRDGLGLIRNARETERLARSVPSTLGVHVVPAFVGLGAPFWDADARGAILGITRGVSRAHIVRATLEAIAFETRDVIEAMTADTGEPLTLLRADGGAAANDFLMQFQADVLGVEVDRPALLDTTAAGGPPRRPGRGRRPMPCPSRTGPLWPLQPGHEGRGSTALAGWRAAVARVRFELRAQPIPATCRRTS